MLGFCFVTKRGKFVTNLSVVTHELFHEVSEGGEKQFLSTPQTKKKESNKTRLFTPVLFLPYRVVCLSPPRNDVVSVRLTSDPLCVWYGEYLSLV